jgi:hypothetical protein
LDSCNCRVFGSFRFGELLAKTESSFNPFETLLWSDIKFFADHSVQIKNKIPKNRTPCGEIVSLFSFPGQGCCPIEALSTLAVIYNSKVKRNSPVFCFGNGSFLTNSKMNKIIVHTLQKHLGNEANSYSCKSFRAALPSALAAYPHLDTDVSIKRWGRWNSDAFERYVRLSHCAKRELFEKFRKALN